MLLHQTVIMVLFVLLRLIIDSRYKLQIITWGKQNESNDILDKSYVIDLSFVITERRILLIYYIQQHF